MSWVGTFARTLRVPRWTAFAAIGSLGAYVVARVITAPTMVDLEVYRIEGAAIRHGMDLYGQLPTPHGLRATYPPFAAIMFVPFSLLPWSVVRVVVTLANVALLYVVSWQASRLAGVARDRRSATALLLAAASIWAEPVFTTFRYGQINLLLLALVLGDFLRSPESRTRGVGIGIATALKITPGLFVVYLLLTKRFRMAAVAIGAFVATLMLSALIVPSATWRFWTRLFYDSDRVGRLENAANQSIHGLVVRASHTRSPHPGWFLLSAAALILGMACAAYAYRRIGDRWGVPACAVAGLLSAPISWSHHWVWCVPIAVLLWQEARRWLPLVFVFWTFAVWYVPHTLAVPPRELHLAPWQIAVSGWYILFGLLFLLLAFSHARRRADGAVAANALDAAPRTGANT